MCEKDVIQAILKGDEKAFKQLVETYQLMVVNTCYAFTHNQEDAEDIAQDVFIQVFNSLPKFRFECKLFTWIYRMAVNRAINYSNSCHGRRIKVDIDVWSSQEVAAEEELSLYTELEKKEQMELLHHAIDQLSEKQRTALILNKYEELSYKEVAEVMGTSVSSVESLIFRARCHLEKQLGKK